MKIEKMFAFVAEDGKGGEGVCGTLMGNKWVALVGADLERVEVLRPIAQDIANMTKQNIKLIYFSERTEMEVIKPT